MYTNYFFSFYSFKYNKRIKYFYNKVFKKEPFQIDTQGELFDGIWVRNNGNLENKNYYSWYTIILFVLPIIFIQTIFIIIKENLC